MIPTFNWIHVAKERGESFKVIDLRRGITEEEARRGEVIDLGLTGNKK